MHYFSRFRTDALFFGISDWCIIFQDFGLMHYFSRFGTDHYFSRFRTEAPFFQDFGLMHYFSGFGTDALFFKISDWSTIFSRFRTDALFFGISDWCIIFQDFGLKHHYFSTTQFCTIFQDFTNRNFEKQYISDKTPFFLHINSSVYRQLTRLKSNSSTETLCIRRQRAPQRLGQSTVTWCVH